ncbi:hypothetical protein [Streptomyces sp. NPDC059575]|uniref:hypothetical protein n=1 Tax=Streptomyces sp. NPDC059575 TaxID=3346872 RepID=UPI0036AEE1C9
MRTTVVGGVLSAVLVLGCVSGCSSDEPKRDFAVPGQLCGVAVPTAPLSKLLPASGGKLTVKAPTAGDDLGIVCEVDVDGQQVLSVERERVGSGRSAWNIASYDHRIGQVKSGAGDMIAYVGKAAVSIVPCVQKEQRDNSVSTYIQTVKPGRADESAMKGLISGYTAALTKQRPC